MSKVLIEGMGRSTFKGSDGSKDDLRKALAQKIVLFGRTMLSSDTFSRNRMSWWQ